MTPLRLLFAGILMVGCSSAAAAPSSGDGGTPPTTVAWPSGATRLRLTWVVYPPRMVAPRDASASHSTPELAVRHVELVARAGAVARRFSLGDELGALFAYNQSVCHTDAGMDVAYPNEPGEIAKIVFYLGGAGGFLVRRAPADELEISGWSEPDGACLDDGGVVTACPREEKTLMRFRSPPRAAIEERIVVVDGSGDETPFPCSR